MLWQPDISENIVMKVVYIERTVPSYYNLSEDLEADGLCYSTSVIRDRVSIIVKLAVLMTNTTSALSSICETAMEAEFLLLFSYDLYIIWLEEWKDIWFHH